MEPSPIASKSTKSSEKSNLSSFYISPSAVASFFHFSCERNLVFTAAGLHRARWFKLENKLWSPLNNEDSIELELCFLSQEPQCKLNDGQVVQIGDLSSEKSIYRRGLWFYEHGGQKIPFENSSSAALEASYRSRNETDPVNLYIDQIDAFHRYTVNPTTLKASRHNFDSSAPQTLNLQRGASHLVDNSHKDIIGDEFKRIGDVWEEQLLKLLESQNHRVIRGSSSDNSRISDSKIDVKTFVKHLETMEPIGSVEDSKIENRLTFFYQPSLVPVSGFYDALGIDRSNLTFSESYPDLLLVEFPSRPEPPYFNIVLKVIDAKASDEVKLSHRVQVSLYVLMLSHFINERVHRKDGVSISISSKGGIWLRDDPTFTEIDLEPVVRFLARFFSDSGRFGSLLTQSSHSGLRNTPWHLDRTCQSCAFLDFCKIDAKKDGKTDISYVYKISKQEKTLAASFVRNSTGRFVSDLEEIHLVLSKYHDDFVEKAKELKLPEVEEELTKQIENLTLSSAPSDASIDELSSKIASVSISSTTESLASAETRDSSPPRPSALQAFKQNNALNITSESTSLTPPGTPSSSGTIPSSSDVSPSVVSTGLPASPFVPAPTKKAKSRTKQHPILSRELWIISKRLEAFKTKQPISLCRASHELVNNEDCAVHINVYTDRPNARTFGWSVFVRPRKKTILDRLRKLSKEDWTSLNSTTNSSLHQLSLDDNGLLISQILTEPQKLDSSAVESIEKNLVESLYRCLEYSAENFASKDTVAIYIWSKQDASDLKKILSKLHFSASQTIRILTAKLLNTLYDSPDAIVRLKHPSLEKDVSHRIVALKSVLETCLALPLSFDADFSHFVHALSPEASVSHQVDPPELLRSWYGISASQDTLTTLIQRFEQRSIFCDLALVNLRQCMLRAAPLSLPRKSHPMAFRTTLWLQHPTLSKLSYVLQYELFNSAMRKMDDRTSVLSGAVGATNLVEERIAVLKFSKIVDGFTPKLRKKKIYHLFKAVQMSENVRSDLMNQVEKNQMIKNWMISSSRPESVSAALAFNDFAKRVRPGVGFSWKPPNAVGFARIVRVADGKNRPEVQLEISFGSSMPQPEKDEIFFLSPIEVDLVGNEAQAMISSLDSVLQLRSVLEDQPPIFIAWLKETIRTALGNQNVIKIPEDENAATLLSLSKMLNLSTEAPVVRSYGKRASKAASAATPSAESPSSDAPESSDSVHSTSDEGPKMISLFPASSGAPILESILSAILLLRSELPVGSVPYSILSDPVSFGLKSIENDPDRAKCEDIALRIEGGLFTAAQRQVFSNLLSRRLQCVWGPPGSGKTHFASTAVAIMAQARIEDAAKHESPGRPFRVLVTAFTHSSIDNLIEKIMDQHKRLRDSLALGDDAAVLPVARLVNKSSVTSSRFAEKQKLTDISEEDAENDSEPAEAVSSDSQPEISQSESSATDPESSQPNAETTPSKRGGRFKRAGAARKVAQRPIFPQVNPQICYADNPSEIRTFMESHEQCVVSGTVWAIRKTFKLRIEKPPEFDLIVIDEASQLLLAHALDPLKYLLASTGRLIVAGDHQQLPPIINAEFPPVQPGEPIFHSSVFDYLQSRDPDGLCTDMLFENWRMNSTLCKLPSRRIYATKDPSKAYQPANSTVANQRFYKERISFQDNLFRSILRPDAVFKVQSQLLQLCLDANKSLVVVRLTSKSGLGLEPFPHAPLVSAVVSAIRRVCQDEFPAESDLSFWSRRLLVVAPHHIQRQVIRSNLLDRNTSWHWPWDDQVAPSIDTVEKAQGREFDSVVIDYGVMDPFRIAREVKFMYSRNRLNVAQSRARCKCILFIADNLLELSKEVFASPAVEAGLSYMQSCVEFAQQLDSLIDIDVDQIPTVLEQLRAEPLFKSPI